MIWLINIHVLYTRICKSDQIHVLSLLTVRVDVNRTFCNVTFEICNCSTKQNCKNNV